MKKLSCPSSWPRPAKIVIVVDTPGWYDTYAERLARRLCDLGHVTRVVRHYDDVPMVDIAFYLSCLRVVAPEVLARNRWNFVVHASDLPKGRGFSPLVWQVLEGANKIPVTMIEMTDEVDAGAIVAQSHFYLCGHELNAELRALLAQAIEDLCVKIVLSPVAPSPREQEGVPTWYTRRQAADSVLDPEKPIAAQFDILRVVDNDRYPAFFDFRGHRYALKIEDLGPVQITGKEGNNG